MRKTLLAAAFFISMFPCGLRASQKAPVTLEGVMTAMMDGIEGSGQWTVNWLREKNARVEFSASIKGPSQGIFEFEGGRPRPVILINSSIQEKTDGYRYYAVLIAREAARLIYAGFPDSAEKRYMVCAAMAETYFELFGTRIELPVFSGVRDEEAGEQVRFWVENDADGGAEAIARLEGAKRISELKAAAEAALAQDPGDAAAQAKLAAVNRSADYFNNVFKPREKTWWTYYQPQ